jgi:hypothetical protein
MALTTKALIKSDWLNIATADTTSDALIDRLIAAVEDEVVSICGQPVEQTSTVWNFTGNGTATVRTPYTVPHTLTSVEYRDDPSESWTTEATCYAYQVGDSWHIYNDAVYSRSFYRATITLGYTTLPDDIVVCANEMVKELYLTTKFAADVDRFGVASISTGAGGQTVTVALQAMRPKVVERLRRFTRVSI